MEITTALGLTVGVLTADEALDPDRPPHPGLDLARVLDPPPAAWPDLRRAGFSVHPAWITWTSPTGESEDAYLGRLSGKERRSVGAGQRFADDQGIVFKVVTPLDAPSFDAFLALYEPQIAAMTHGVPYAAMERADILDQRADYVAVQAIAGDDLVGSCVCRIRRDVSTMVIRFSATAPGNRQQRLVRALYMRVFDTAREMGLREVSLGSDPALYGHMTRPGLFAFKSALRFTPVPSRFFGSMDDPDEATRVLRLDALTDPSLLLTYDVRGADRIGIDTPLRLDLLTGDADTDPAPYRAPFLQGTDVVHVGAR